LLVFSQVGNGGFTLEAVRQARLAFPQRTAGREHDNPAGIFLPRFVLHRHRYPPSLVGKG
jgi:hypothetical protein